jgi:hypothetical protein
MWEKATDDADNADQQKITQIFIIAISARKSVLALRAFCRRDACDPKICY